MRINRFIAASAFIAGLSVPSLIFAQAIPRTEPPTSGGGTTTTTTTSSGGGAVSRDVPSPPPSMPSAPQSQPTRSAPPKSGTSSSGSSTSSSTPSSGGAVTRGGGTTSSRPIFSTGGSNETPVYVGAGTRSRDGRPIGNTAIRRPSPIGGYGGDYLGSAGYPFSPWGRWYPWYNGGWGYGYVSWDPWRVGTTRWVWGRYGTWWYGATPWYDPWYDPWFMYDNFYGSYGPYMYLGGGGGSRDEEPRPLTGSIRVRATPEKARVYIDGVLQGVVDDFNGLSKHLDVPVGTHQIELKLEGFVPLKDEIVVEGGKTQTFRGSLKKSSK